MVMTASLSSSVSPLEKTNSSNFANHVIRGGRVKSVMDEFYRSLDRQYVTAKLQRAIDSPRQLQEVMTEFWYQHFNVCINKDIDRVWVGPYEDQAIRPFALGRFRDLLGATCHHPAMLYYLDNWQNTAPKSKGAKGNLKGLNENYARELMELHTLGVDGGYTQKDVIELARILTGLGFPRDPANACDGSDQPVGASAPFSIHRDTIMATRLYWVGTLRCWRSRSRRSSGHVRAGTLQLRSMSVSNWLNILSLDAPPKTLVAQMALRFRCLMATSNR